MKWIFGKKQEARTGMLAVHIEETGAFLQLSVAYAPQKSAIQEIAEVFTESCKNAKEVEIALARFVSRHQLQGTACSYVLSPTEYSLILTEAPAVPTEEMAQAMRWMLQELINFPVVEAVVDTIELPLPRARDNVKMVYAVIMRRSVLPKIEHRIKAAALRLVALDIPELALNNLIKRYANSDQYLIFIQIQATGGQLILSRNGLIYMLRSVEIKFEAVESLESNTEKEAILNELGIEIKRLIDYFTNLFREANFHAVVLFPSILDLTPITEYLKEKLGLEVMSLELNKLLSFSESITAEVGANALLSIGAALRRDDLI